MNILSIISTGLLFTNTILFTTNSSIGTATVRDEILGTQSYLSLNLNKPIRDVNGNFVSVVTNAGEFAILSSVGWGYQQNLSIPSGVTSFNSYVPGSLSYGLVTNLQARTNGLTPSSEAMFSSANWVTTNFTPNANFWLKAAPQKTAIVIGEGNPLTGSIGGSAVSPRHVINCSHAQFGIGTTLVFVDDTGSSIVRSVIAVSQIAGTDISVELLNADLPSTIHPFTVLPLTFTNEMTLMHPNIQLVGCNQSKQMFPKLTWTFSAFNSQITTFSSALWLGVAWNYSIIGGDSGHPLMIMVGTNLVLVSGWYEAFGDGSELEDNYEFYESQINAAMHFLSTNNAVGSDYQLTTADLSGWPTY